MNKYELLSENVRHLFASVTCTKNCEGLYRYSEDLQYLSGDLHIKWQNVDLLIDSAGEKS